jgi:hypothetical protein
VPEANEAAADIEEVRPGRRGWRPCTSDLPRFARAEPRRRVLAYLMWATRQRGAQERFRRGWLRRRAAYGQQPIIIETYRTAGEA